MGKLHSKDIPVILLLAALILRALLGFSGLLEQGLRNVDEGYYAFQGLAVCLGIEHGVWNKPAHDLLLAAGYKVLGPFMSTPLMVTGLLSLCSIFIVFLVVKGMDSPLSGALSGLAFAIAPYSLLYARSAYSESNYVSWALVGILLWQRACMSKRETSARPRHVLLLFLAAGAGLGLAITTNSAVLPLIGITLFSSFLTKKPWSLGALKGWIMPLASVGAGCLLVIVVILAPLWLSGLLNEERFWSSITYHARTAGRSTLTWKGPLYCLKFGLGVPLLLFIPAAWRLWRTRGWEGLEIPLAGVLLLLFYLRISVSYPRIFLPLIVPILLLSGPGLIQISHGVASWLKRPQAVALGLLMPAFILPPLVTAVKILPPPSGYMEACDWLMQDQPKNLVTTHSWWTFMSFVGCKAACGSDQIAEILTLEEPEASFLKFLAKSYEKGHSHLVLDFMLWNRLKPGSSARLGEFMRQHPPDKVIPNLVARHEETFLEDGDIPDLRQDPLAWNIYIYRLDRFATGQDVRRNPTSSDR